jgi:hypothetical protein
MTMFMVAGNNQDFRLYTGIDKYVKI